MVRAFPGTLPRIHSTAFVADTAYVIGDVELGRHSSVWFQTLIRGDVMRLAGQYREGTPG